MRAAIAAIAMTRPPRMTMSRRAPTTTPLPILVGVLHLAYAQEEEPTSAAVAADGQV